MPPSPKRRALLARSNDLTSLLLVFPLFLVYQIGVIAVPQAYNGADLFTGQLLRLFHGQLGWYLLVNAVLLAAFVVAVALLRRKNEFHPRQFIPVLIESSLYAVTMGALIVFVMTRVLHIDPRLAVGASHAGAAATSPHDVGLFGRILISFGAGVHEELVFRLLLLSALVWVGAKLLGMRRGIAVAIAFLASSLLFSAAHHVIGGEPFRVGVFVYRTLCGLIFATLFWVRGFAVAVYTHALYDVFVLVVR
jgi:membrane protease YdiL (CAAX protease family)